MEGSGEKKDVVSQRDPAWLSVYSEVEQMAACGRQRYFRFWGQLRARGCIAYIMRACQFEASFERMAFWCCRHMVFFD
jgi:hypothetical protein